MDVARAERDSDLGDDSPMSHDDQSDREDDMRDCDSSDEGVNVTQNANGTSMGYGRSPDHNTDIPLSHHAQFPPNHPLGMLSNFMGVPGLQNLPNLQHGDVLEKLKMQVRDMKVGLMMGGHGNNELSDIQNGKGLHPNPNSYLQEQDFPVHGNYGATLPTPANTSFSVPPTVNGISQSQNLAQPHPQTNGFPFPSPNVSNPKDANPASNSSTSSEASNSSQQNNGWSFEEQFKQVRQLYEINDDPKRKEFLDDLFMYMQKRGTPINRLPIMAKSVLDLYELYNLVIARGGLVDVINKKLWQEIIKGLHLPSSITSAAFTLRTQYMKYLYPYECDKKNLSTPTELQAAIDGNRREGRRSSYGQFEAMQNQLQMPQMQRSPAPSSMQQMTPLALVTHAAAPSAHHRLMAPPLAQMPGLMPHELEQRMMECFKYLQAPKEMRRSQSPDIQREALNALELSRIAMWSMYNNNTSPPASINTSPNEPQREALNLSDSPPHVVGAPIKRERERSNSLILEREFNQPPPAKKTLPNNFHQTNNNNNNHNRVPDEQNETDDDSRPQPSPSHRVEEPPAEYMSQQTSQVTNLETTHNLLSGMQFKISRRENGANGEQLVVNMELNGVQYQGVLIATPTSNNTSRSSAPDPASSAINDRKPIIS